MINQEDVENIIAIARGRADHKGDKIITEFMYVPFYETTRLLIWPPLTIELIQQMIETVSKRVHF